MQRAAIEWLEADDARSSRSRPWRFALGAVALAVAPALFAPLSKETTASLPASTQQVAVNRAEARPVRPGKENVRRVRPRED